MGIRDRVAALLGFSAHRALDVPGGAATLGDSDVNRIREAHGGQLGLTPQSVTRWYLKDIESAELAADSGDLSHAARLMRSARRDGVYSGVLSTRTGGLVRLPKRFRGDDEIVASLKREEDDTRGVFDEMFPATELALLAADGLELGVGVAELVPVIGREFPIMVRLDPEWLWYRWNENRWYYRSIAGMLPITPGDGRWILHMPGGRVSPWQHGTWRAVARAYIRKEHANFRKDNWESKLANAARVAFAPQAASQTQKDSWFQSVMSWGTNTVFGLTPGYEVKLLESNGRGHESFVATIKDQNTEFQIVVAGQTITTEGGSGFDNQDVHLAIRADLIKETADGLAYTINTQGLPQYIIDRFGEDRLLPGVTMEWDITPPADRAKEAASMAATATAITSLTKALAPHGLKLDAKAITIAAGIPVVESNATDKPDALLFDMSLTAALELAQRVGLQPTEEAIKGIVERAGIELEELPRGQTPPVKIPLSPTDVARVTRVDEARASLQLGEWGDENGKLSISEFSAQVEANAKAAAEANVVEVEGDEQRETDDNKEGAEAA